MAAILNGAQKASDDLGFEAILMAPAIDDSVEDQVRIMDDMIQRGVDAFIISAVDSNGIMPSVRRAEEAGIIVSSIVTPPAQETFLRTGVDFVESGHVIARRVADRIGGTGEVIIIEGPPGAQNSQERLFGIMEMLENYPDIEVVASQTANFRRVEGMQVAENLLQRHRDVAAIIALNDEMAIGAMQAVSAAGLDDVVIAGFDGNRDASTAIKEGGLYVSYNTDPFGAAYLASTYIVQYLNDGTPPPQYFVPFPSAKDNPLLTQENVDDFINDFAWWD
jgi:ABC-type sugar transport system substrate-binding protein